MSNFFHLVIYCILHIYLLSHWICRLDMTVDINYVHMLVYQEFMLWTYLNIRVKMIRCAISLYVFYIAIFRSNLKYDSQTYNISSFILHPELLKHLNFSSTTVSTRRITQQFRSNLAIRKIKKIRKRQNYRKL